MNEEFLVGIDEDPNIIVINDEWGVKGALEVKIVRNENPNLQNIDQDFLISGALRTGYYARELKKLETRRYVINNIDVTEENYESGSNDILYRFKSSSFRVKYQIGDVINVHNL